MDVPFLYQEIFEQPAVIERLLSLESAHVAQIAGKIRASQPRYIFIVARGSSDNAARYGQYLFGNRAGMVVALAAPSLFTRYNTPPNLQEALVIGISQSGASTDIVAVLNEAHRQGAETIAIVNVPESPLAQAAAHVICCQAGEERSLAATKTYTAQLAALALLAAQLGQDAQMQVELAHLPDAMRQVLTTAVEIRQASQRYRYMERCVVIGRGYNYATAFELALKLKELTYIAAEPYSSADFMHGPIAVVSPGYPVLVVAPHGVLDDDTRVMVEKLKERGAELLVISELAEFLDQANTALRLPAGVPEWLSPLLAVLPGQLFAFYLTLAKGYEPDHPRGLHKVTLTR